MESSLKESFGQVLAQLRKANNISQQELADNCNIERAYISRLERGLFQPTITIIFKIADYFGIKPSEIIEQLDIMRKKRAENKKPRKSGV
ncbi:MAG: helix-turn-helix transcriptional regulator [Bacteroidetes bacterium]|nr:helix-turn-helix transcriptional regulator [Bacteroidota bacterium]